MTGKIVEMFTSKEKGLLWDLVEFADTVDISLAWTDLVELSLRQKIYLRCT